MWLRYSTSQDLHLSGNYRYEKELADLHQHIADKEPSSSVPKRRAVTFPRVIGQSEVFLSSRAATAVKNAITGGDDGRLRPCLEPLIKYVLSSIINNAKASCYCELLGGVVAVRPSNLSLRSIRDVSWHKPSICLPVDPPGPCV